MGEGDVGNFRILEKLGEGGMGVVYKAVDTTLDRLVAIKILNRDLSRIPELVARFRNEAKAQANLNHTNLATLYAFLIFGENAMMVMELVDGETFHQIIRRRGPLPAQGAVPMFRQALLGFAYAHRAGVIHRDIKPSNLMLNKQGIVKVMDFGIAKIAGERGLTKSGARVGTSRYMSPEQVLNKDIDIRSDIYALGLTLYEMLTATTPFSGDSEFQVMSDHVNTPPPPPTQFCPHIPKGVENAILKALAKDPGDRFQTAGEFGAALEHPDDFGLTAQRPSGTRISHPPGEPVPSRLTMPPVKAAPVAPAPVRPTVAQSTIAPPPPPPPAKPEARPVPPPPARKPPAGVKVLFETWPGRIVLIGIGALVIVMLGLFVAKPDSPRPLPPPISSQSVPSQAVETAPSPERVEIDFGSEAVKPLEVKSFAASPNPIRPGQHTTLSWSVPGAVEVSISPTVGAVPAEGSRHISAHHDAEFTLTAKSITGQTVTRTVTVAVEQAAAKPKPPVESRKIDVATALSPASQPQQPPPVAQSPQRLPAPAPQPPPRQQQPQQQQPQPTAPPQQPAGASPIMNLYHDHGLLTGTQYTWPHCWGQMRIAGGQVFFRVLGTSDGRRDDFVVPVSALDEVRVNRMPIQGRPAFHIRVNGQNFNFIPAAGSPIMYVNVIEQWLHAR